MKCFSCNQRLTANVWQAVTVDGQEVLVGSCCAKQIILSGMDGWQPKLGGPRLYNWDLREEVWKREREKK
jgi:hypothetical protein